MDRKTDRYKQKVLKAGIILTMLLILCTILSSSVEAMLLPQVYSVQPGKGELEFRWQYTGSVIVGDITTVEWLCDARTATDLYEKNHLKIEARWFDKGENAKKVCSLALQPGSLRSAGTQARLSAAGISSFQPEEGTQVQLTLRAAEPYDTIVPLSCLVHMQDGKYGVMLVETKKGLWGIQDTVRYQEVRVLDSNAGWAALAGAWDTQRVAAYPTRKLEDGERVQVIE